MSVSNNNSEPSVPDDAAIQWNLNPLISGLTYISESEAPVELLYWPEVKNIDNLQEAIAQKLSVPKDLQSVLKPEDFLAAIHRMATPEDKAMLTWSKRWDKLFKFLSGNGRQVYVVRGGKSPAHIIIAAFGVQQAIVLHTTAVET